MTSSLIQSVGDARRAARRRLPRLVFDFIDGAAGEDSAAARNLEALRTIQLQPRVCLDVSHRRLSQRILGREFGLPFGIAPMGMCNLTMPRADEILCAAANRHGIPLCVSTAASTTLEEVRERCENAWFQLYVGQSREAAMALVGRAETAGYEHLVLTLDTPEIARRPRELRGGFSVPFRMGPRQLLDFALHPSWSLATLRHGVPQLANNRASGDARAFERGASRAGLDWHFVATLRERWSGKLILKGITAPADAERAVGAGADALYVSNHGGRQLDSAPAAIELLARVRDGVDDSIPIIFDSGIRSGEDVIKALATGADFVMLGRAVLYALAAGGAGALQHVIEMIAHDLSVAMAQIGCTEIASIDRRVIAECLSTPAESDDGQQQAASRRAVQQWQRG